MSELGWAGIFVFGLALLFDLVFIGGGLVLAFWLAKKLGRLQDKGEQKAAQLLQFVKREADQAAGLTARFGKK